MSNWYITYENGEFIKKEQERDLQINSDEVLVRPLSVGICGSDLYSIKHNDGESEIGHEWIGEVLEVGSSIDNYKVGEIISSAANYCCQKCKACLSKDWKNCNQRKLLGSNGVSVISNKIKIHKSDLVKLPQDLSRESLVLFEVAFIGDLSYSHAKSIGLKAGDEIVIFGAGPIGIFSYLALKHRGYNPVLVEKSMNRVTKAKKLNLNVKNFANFLISGTNFAKYDVVIDCTGDGAGGTGALPQLHLFSKTSGAVVIIGKYLDAKLDNNSFYRKNLRVSWLGYHGVEEFRESVKFWTPIIEDYAKAIVTNFEFEDVENAFNIAKQRDHIKCVLNKK